LRPCNGRDLCPASTAFMSGVNGSDIGTNPSHRMCALCVAGYALKFTVQQITIASRHLRWIWEIDR
jgi:hypothetical protein